MTLIIVIVVIVLLIAIYAGLYNSLIQLRTHAQESWSQIDVQLQRRNDLIPNLISTVKGYSKYEAGTLEKVTKLRTELNSIPDSDHAKKMEVSNELTGTLRTLFAVAENYPDLKASQNFIQLSDELAGTENRIATERNRYNESVQTFNAKIRKFPTSFIASIMGVEKRDYFEAQAGADQAPSVNF